MSAIYGEQKSLKSLFYKTTILSIKGFAVMTSIKLVSEEKNSPESKSFIISVKETSNQFLYAILKYTSHTQAAKCTRISYYQILP